MDDDRTALMTARALSPGYEILWYTIKGVLGQGGFGITYLAHDRNLDCQVAIKEYLPVSFAYRHQDFSVKPLTGDHQKNFAWGLDSFLKEAQTLAKFNHDNIVRVYSVFEQNRTAYMVMGYEHGESLASIYRNGAVKDQAFFENVFFPIFDGLDAIHHLGFIHRDIKPANIYIRENGTPVLIDFGSARQTSQQDTGEMTALVSMGYTPLEQYSANYGDQGPWTDIYALAATVYEGVVGSRPEESLGRSASLMRRKVDSLKPLEDASFPGFSKTFLGSVHAALSLEPEARPETLSHWLAMFQGEVPFEPLATRKMDTRAPYLNSEYDASDDRTRTKSRDTEWARGIDSDSQTRTQTERSGRSVTSKPPDEHDAFDFNLNDLPRKNEKQQQLPGSGSKRRKRPRGEISKKKRMRWMLPVTGFLAVAGLAGSAYWWVSLSPGGSTIDSAALAKLPRPPSPVSTVLPKDQLLKSLEDKALLASFYAKAHAIRADDPELQAGIERAYDDLLTVSKSWSASNHRDVAERIVQVANLLPDVANQRSNIRSTLDSTDASSNVDAILAMIQAQRYVEPAGSSVLDRVTSLSQSDYQRVITSELWIEMMEQFRQSAVASLSTSDFEQTARIVEAALTLDPDDSGMAALRAHLSLQ